MHPADQEDAARANAKEQRSRQKLFRADFQHLLNDPRNRSIIYAFIESTGLDVTAFNTNAMAQSYRNGQQDAGRWWVNWMREHCPEREQQMRNEARANRPATNEESDDE